MFKNWIIHRSVLTCSLTLNDYCPENLFTESSLKIQKIGVWAALSATQLFGPYFYSDTINQSKYREILTKLVKMSLGLKSVILSGSNRMEHQVIQQGIPFVMLQVCLVTEQLGKSWQLIGHQDLQIYQVWIFFSGVT